MPAAAHPEGTVALQMHGIRKAFPGVQALAGVDLVVRCGEVHVLLGENGAGKSTLMKVLSGSVARDAGRIEVFGRDVDLASPRAARDAGIAIIHQELALVPQMTVAENVFLGRAPARFGVVDQPRMVREATALLAQLGATIDPNALVGSLSIAQQQLVEIARALSLRARILIMDEPTSALTERETERLFGTIEGLTATGTAIIYISHRLDEIFAIGDRITVLRDGRHVATRDVQAADRRELVRLMADRDVEELVPAGTHTPGRPLLRVEGLSRGEALSDVSFSVRAGEIVGFYGLLGAGRTEIARAVFGLEPFDRGTILVDGQPCEIRSPQDAIAAGIGFVTEDRQREGLVLERSVRDNVALPILSRLARLGVVHTRREQQAADTAVRDLRIRTPSTRQLAQHLSGGNQQKIVLAKWLATGARILFLDEPTRGIDVGSKQEIYQLIQDLARAGVAIVLMSSDLPEVLGLADRVLVMRAGRIAGQFTRSEATAERVMACAVGS
ncbi:MAG: sugar ABC transporter ATP-binding protein [Gemmatimonadaceae bacterium]|nr:sugar ABC transporter ATP-binding protein [Gemmatimonadaceae bacterium]